MGMYLDLNLDPVCGRSDFKGSFFFSNINIVYETGVGKHEADVSEMLADSVWKFET